MSPWLVWTIRGLLAWVFVSCVVGALLAWFQIRAEEELPDWSPTDECDCPACVRRDREMQL